GSGPHTRAEKSARRHVVRRSEESFDVTRVGAVEPEDVTADHLREKDVIELRLTVVVEQTCGQRLDLAAVGERGELFFRRVVQVWNGRLAARDRHGQPRCGEE